MNFYQILGVRPTATSEEIADAYEAQKGRGDFERQLEVSMAYTALTDENLRDEHDEELYTQLEPVMAGVRHDYHHSGKVAVNGSQRTPQYESNQPVKWEAQPSRCCYPLIPQSEFNKHSPQASLLSVCLVWFMMAGASVVIVFLLALMRL